MNLRLKLFLPFVVMFTAVYCVSTFYLFPSYTDFLECEQISHETAQVELLSAALAPELIDNDMEHIFTSMDGAQSKRKHWHSLILVDESGNQLYPTEKIKRTDTTQLTVIKSPITAEEKSYGSMILSFDPKPAIEKQIGYAYFLYYAVLAILVFTFFIMCTFLDRLIRRPIVKLAGLADQIANGNYQASFPMSSQDEVGRLSSSLDTMRQKIHQRDIAMNYYAEIQHTIRFIQSKFISEQDESHLFLELQCKILALTKSDAGLIGEVHKKDEQLLLKALSLNGISNIHPNNDITSKALPECDYLPELETLLGKVIITGQPSLDNGPEISTNRLGFPVSGESTVDNFLGLPLYRGNQLIGVLGLVNKKGGFDLAMFKELEILLQTLAQLIVAIRERKALTDNETRLRLVVDSAIEGIMSADENGLITGLNAAAERIFGYTAKQLIGQSVGLLIPPENHYNHLEAARFMLENNNPDKSNINTEIETDALHRNGKLIPIELSFSRVISECGQIQYTSVVRDITERKQHESELNRAYAELQETHEKLEQQNRIDSLTGLANRRYLDEALRLEWKRAQRLENSPLTIMLCDIDYFKKYNDTYGHLQGDDCLIHVAKTMAESFTRNIDLVARYGGEEFMIVLPNTSIESAVKQADIMREKIWSLDIKHKSSQIADRVTISIGIYTVQPTVNHKLRKAIQRSDEALYDAKDNGRNQVCYYQKAGSDVEVSL